MFVPTDYPEVLVGLGSPDDAAVYRLDAGRTLIVTADFFTPIVDDAYEFGAIAAANALSDVYAMGGEPVLAINLVAFPPDLLDVLAEVLRGGAEMVKEAGIALAGGHTIQDKEPKYGLAVIGLAHPDRLLTRGGARPGDALVLTKPLGTGVIVTAFKRGQAEPAHLAGAVRWMKTLNRTASRIAVGLGLHGASDVTGFGLLGHAREMALASGVGMEIRVRDVPLMEGARECAHLWLFPRGSFCNRDFFGRHVQFADDIGKEMQMLLFDAQTSGGLLLAVPPEKLRGLLDQLRAEGEPGWVIGQVVREPGIEVRKDRPFPRPYWAASGCVKVAVSPPVLDCDRESARQPVILLGRGGAEHAGGIQREVSAGGPDRRNDTGRGDSRTHLPDVPRRERHGRLHPGAGAQAGD